MKFSFPFRFESWLEGETLNGFLSNCFGLPMFKRMKIIHNRNIQMEHYTIEVFQLFIKNGPYDDPLDTLYMVSNEEYDKVMEMEDSE